MQQQRISRAGVSAREAEVLASIAEHLTNAEIAARLFISVRTVESHVSSLLRKLGVGDRRALAGLAADIAGGVAPSRPGPQGIVGTGRLADAVWGDAASPKAVQTLQSHVSFLRNALGDKAAIVSRPPGYLLDLDGDGTDVRLAERLFQAASQADNLVCRVRTLQSALALWRGQPLADAAGSAWLEQQAERLDQLRLQVKRALYQARLTAGEHGQLIPELEQLAAGQPLDEHVQAQLMLALYRSGRQADALAVYRLLRRTLDEQLGIDPSRMLRELETAILRQDPVLDAPAPAWA